MTTSDKTNPPRPDIPPPTPTPEPDNSGGLPILLLFAAIMITGGALSLRYPSTAYDFLGPHGYEQPTVRPLDDALAELRAGNTKSALTMLTKLAKAGNARAQYRVAALLAEGFPGRKPDFKAAVHWYRKAADQGVVAAKAGLGRLYLNGIGILQDFSKARPLLGAAADDGNAQAQYDLARMWQHGWGGEKHAPTAYALFELSARQDYRPAIKARDALLKTMQSAQITEGGDLLEAIKDGTFHASSGRLSNKPDAG
jgi:TPR repeat protein